MACEEFGGVLGNGARHFVLETHAPEIAALIAGFLGRLPAEG